VKILSFETSCDETAASIVALEKKPQIEFKILGDNLSSQAKIHAKYGGVYPAMAKREHAKNILPLLVKTLKEAKLLKKEANILSPKIQKNIEKLLEREGVLGKKLIKFLETTAKPNIDLITVTYGPGLEPALWVGLNFAKALALAWDIKLMPTNHMEGHIVSSLITFGEARLKPVMLPALALLISGGHTELVLVKEKLTYEIIGETRDDAAGEAFDKTARLLGLSYPGGPEISRLAKLKSKIKYKLPRPMIKSPDFDFSFSGLKTAVLYLVKKLGRLNKEKKIAIAREFQDAVTDVLIYKTMRAVKKYKIKTLLIGGGVSANEQIRKALQKVAAREKVTVYFPERELSVDNSVMIGLAGYFRFINKSKMPPLRTIRACGTLRLQ